MTTVQCAYAGKTATNTATKNEKIDFSKFDINDRIKSFVYHVSCLDHFALFDMMKMRMGHLVMMTLVHWQHRNIRVKLPLNNCYFKCLAFIIYEH